jgi:CPA2 family monovalent cation:H+ antiporter-2
VVRVLLVDAVAVAAIVIGASIGAERAPGWIAETLGLTPPVASAIFLVLAVLVAVPFLVGLVRNGRRLGLALASAALPEAAAGRPDLAAAPRRVLLALVQLGTTVLVLLPVIALTQPFLPGVPGAAILVGALVILGFGFWRSAANLQGHVRAGAQVIVEALAKQGAAAVPHGDAAARPDALAAIRTMFPGLGEPVAVRLPAGSPAEGQTLAGLGVRGKTGAAVLAIFREGESVMLPTAGEALRPGDVLALAGTHEAVESARALLGAEPSDAPVLDRSSAPLVSPRSA